MNAERQLVIIDYFEQELEKKNLDLTKLDLS